MSNDSIKLYGYLDDDLTPSGWFANDGNAEIHYPEATSAREAAEQYVEGGEWGDTDRTIWVSVHTWRVNEGARIDEQTVKIPVEPIEPECSDPEGHDWEDGDLRGSGGGVRWTDTCHHCGLRRTGDSWAQDPVDGEQGLSSTRYSR